MNTAVGAGALGNGAGGNNDVALGVAALANATGDNNTAVGYNAGLSQTTGSNNVYIGAGIQGLAGDDGVCRIASIFNATITGGTQVFINSANRLGTSTSSKRFKEDIKPMDKASEAILALRPVSFRYKKEIDPQGIPEFGLIAEEVEKVNPALVIRDPEGRPYSVRYEQVNAMLLNEFLKEHKKAEEQQGQITELNSKVARQEAMIARQGKGMEVLIAQLKEQAAQIQKVSAQMELSKPAQRTVLSNP